MRRCGTATWAPSTGGSSPGSAPTRPRTSSTGRPPASSPSGPGSPTALDEAALTTRQVPAWPDSAAALERLAARYEVVGLSNADLTTLLRLDARAGLRWHLSLSAELARSFKPDPRVYRLALERIGRPAGRTMLVATHAWDLRAARAEGMRTAYLARPTGDPPTSDDTFDHHVASVDELLAVLLDRPSTTAPGAPPC